MECWTSIFAASTSSGSCPSDVPASCDRLMRGMREIARPTFSVSSATRHRCAALRCRHFCPRAANLLFTQLMMKAFLQLLLATLCLWLVAPSDAAAPKPNVIVFLVDDMG